MGRVPEPRGGVYIGNPAFGAVAMTDTCHGVLALIVCDLSKDILKPTQRQRQQHAEQQADLLQAQQWGFFESPVQAADGGQARRRYGRWRVGRKGFLFPVSGCDTGSAEPPDLIEE